MKWAINRIIQKKEEDRYEKIRTQFSGSEYYQKYKHRNIDYAKTFEKAWYEELDLHEKDIQIIRNRYCEQQAFMHIENELSE